MTFPSHIYAATVTLMSRQVKSDLFKKTGKSSISTQEEEEEEGGLTMQQCSLMSSSRAVSFLTETRNARCKIPSVSTSLPFSFYWNQLQMGVGHTGIVIQLLHVGRNITVTRLFICREGKQDGPITFLQIYWFFFIP